MVKKKEHDLDLPSLDDLFSSQKTRDESNGSKIQEIPLDLIDDYPNHPFKVRDDLAMQKLINSIDVNGVITPALLRIKEDGRYQMISGHRRKKALTLKGETTIRSEVIDVDDNTATVLMVDSNLQRPEILPSEKAFAYKMRLEAMKRQGFRTDLSSDPMGPRIRSNTLLAREVQESETQIKRYIRLTELIPEILDLVDDGKIGIRPAVEISYLPKGLQATLLDAMKLEDSTPSHAQTVRMRKLLQEDKLTPDAIYAVLQEEKPNQRERIVLRSNRVIGLIPKNVPVSKREDYIIKALEFFSKSKNRSRER